VVSLPEVSLVRILKWFISVVLLLFFVSTIAVFTLGKPEPFVELPAIATAIFLTIVNLAVFLLFLGLYALAGPSIRCAEAMRLRGGALGVCGVLLRAVTRVIGFACLFFGACTFRLSEDPLQRWGLGLLWTLFGALLFKKTLNPQQADRALAEVFYDDRPLRKIWRNVIAHLNRPL